MALSGVRWIPGTPIIVYTAVFIAASLVYWLVCRQALNTSAETGGLIPVLLILFFLRMSFVGVSPRGSDDVYRYMWDGRVQSAGINPYKYKPDDQTLSGLHTAMLPSHVNHPEMQTVYFPLAEWLFFVSYNLCGEQIWGYHLLILLAEIVTMIGLLLLMRGSAMSPWRVLLYAANPLVILQYSLDAHVDALGFPFLIFGLLLYQRRNITPALLLMGMSLLIKPVALVLLPILFLDQKGWMNKARVAIIPIAILAASFTPYMLDANPFEGLATFSKHWFFNGALFSILFPLISDNQTTRLWCLVVLGLLLLVLCFSRKPLHHKMAFAVLLLILCSPVAHPWYMGWLVVLLPVAAIASGITLAGTASLVSITFVSYQLEGVWKDFPLVLILEYVPVVALLLVDLAGRNRGWSGRDKDQLGDTEIRSRTEGEET